MKIHVLPAGALTPDHEQNWARLQRSNPDLASPYFCAEFTRAVAQVRSDVEVAILEHEGQIAGFFPFQRGSFGLGQPVGGPMSDFQAMICGPSLTWDCHELIRACGLAAWDFDHLIASQQSFAPFHAVKADSPFMDLSAGYAGYRARRRASGSYQLPTIERKARKLEREVGPLDFRVHSVDEGTFQRLLDWKSAQYQSTGVTDLFRVDWSVALLRKVCHMQTEGFAGLLSALHAGDRLAAVHLGMRSRHVWHWWFPAYDPALSAYSPGLVLLVKMAETAEALGIQRIDLGKGDAPYKNSMMTNAITLAEGSVERCSLVTKVRRCWRRTEDWLRQSPLKRVVRIPGRFIRRLWDRQRYG